MRLVVVAVVLLAVAPGAQAHHRQTPPVVAITTAGDASLPRLAPPSRKAAAVVVDAAVEVVDPFVAPTAPVFQFQAGTNANPSISSNGRTIAWDSDADPLGSGAPGRQVLEQSPFALSQLTSDPTAASTNPALDLVGVFAAFESTGDPAGTGNAGARQVFLRTSDGTVRQLSRGTGTSRNAAVGLRGRIVVFESTSDPVSGADTGVAQIWLADVAAATAAPITSGMGASTNPTLSNDGRVVVFESRADLAGAGQDTSVPQIFAYDTFTKTFARVSDDVTGCTSATSARIKRDWRIAYRCGADAFFTMLHANQRFHVATDGGDTTRLVTQADAHFVLVATTADLLGSGTTSGHRVYKIGRAHV